MTTPISRLKTPLILWTIVTTFFAFQFIIRLSAGILREDIMQKFGLSTVAFGHLAGYYYLGYAGMQIPIGYMLDRFNFRYVTFASIIATVLGTFAFSIAEKWEYVLLARFLIGAGSAAGFLSIAKVTKTFFPENMHSRMLGFAFTLGLSGAVLGGKPTKILFDNFGYNGTLAALSLIGVAIGLSLLMINDRKIEKFEHDEGNLITAKQTFGLLLNPTILFIGICGGLMVGALEGFADVWAIPFFSQVYHFSEYDSIFLTSVIYIGMCFGGPLLALGSEKFKSNISMILATGIATALIFLVLFMNSNLGFYSILVLMFITGIVCCYQVLVFTLATQLVSKSCASLAIAIINCINMSFGHFFHVGISNLMQHYWNGALSEKNTPIYSLHDFIVGLSPIPIFCLIGTLGFLVLSVKQKRGKLKPIDL